MPKKKRSKGDSHARKQERAVSRRERKAGTYIKPGDPEFKDLSTQLGVQGLTLKDVPGDGNCLFRALAEQLDDHHSNLRQRAVQHIRAHSADYAPFLDEDTAFESYVDELSKDGTFAGNDAIVAVSRACAVNVVIHQLGAPRWEVRAPDKANSTLHIAYLRGEHYCSVQALTAGQALPQVESRLRHPAAAKSGNFGGGRESDMQSVLEATGCQDRVLAEQCYMESGGNVELAIVELLQLMTLMEAVDVQVADEDMPQLNPSTPLASKTPKHHMSNRERKEAAKAAKKQAAIETRQLSKSTDKEDKDTAPLGATSI